MSGAADPVTEWRETDGPLDPGSAGEAARPGRRADAQAALPLEEPEAVPSTHLLTERVLEPSRALVATDLAPPSLGAGDRLIQFAYRLGIPGHALTLPMGRREGVRLLATVDSPLSGDRAAGVALRAGHFLVHGVKAPIGQVDFAGGARLTPPFERLIHGYGWLRDLGGCTTRDQAAPVATRIHAAWLDANREIGKGRAWDVELVGYRLLAWLIHAPLIMGEDPLRGRTLAAIEEAARWLDRNVGKAQDRLGQVIGWAGIVAAGLLLPGGKPRRLFGETGLARALGELTAEDGGVLSRSPIAQMDAIAVLVDLEACYRAVDRDPPKAVSAMKALLVPPLLSLLHGHGGLGSWQGGNALSTDSIAALVGATGVRTRPLKDVRHWGYQRVAAREAVLQFDAAPPPLPRHARGGCASTLAFEFSTRGERLIVNCGGAATAGGQVPVRIEQGLRGTAAHSTLVLDESNSTAVLLKGQLGMGVKGVEIDRRQVETGRGRATRLDATHDGYASRYGLLHRRILVLRDDGTELLGEDVLTPQGKRGKRGKIAFAIRFHCGRGVEVRRGEDGRGATLLMPGGQHWQFRLGSECDGELAVDESIWVDGHGRPQPIQQIVIQGMTSRSGGSFSWLLKQMG